jgi:Bacterial Ig domain
VLAGDTDRNGDALTAQLDASTAHGALTLEADGFFRYTPERGFTGIDRDICHVSDAKWTAPPATVTIRVAGGPGMPPRLDARPGAGRVTLTWSPTLFDGGGHDHRLRDPTILQPHHLDDRL